MVKHQLNIGKVPVSIGTALKFIEEVLSTSIKGHLYLTKWHLDNLKGNAVAESL